MKVLKGGEQMGFWKMWLFMKRLLRTRRTRLYLVVVCVASAAAASRLLTGGLLGAGAGQMDLKVIDLVIQARLHESILDEKGTGCEVPRLDPFSEEAIRYDDYDQPKLKCEGTDWVRCHVSKCYVIEEVLKRMKEIYCIYKDILYINDNKYVMGEPVKLYGNETYTLNKSDHVKVSCTGMEVGAILPSIWFGHKIGFRVLEKKQTDNIKRPSHPCKPLNVMILCFHSTSRNRFTRRMPRSLKVLTEELNATIFNVHTIVGEGTAAALLPLMTGKSEVELPDTRKKTSKAYIEVKNFIFHIAKINGFRTAFYEDVEYVGTLQNQNNGFSQQPADHYLRAFHLEAILNRKLLTSYRNSYCIGSTPLHKKILQLTQQLPKLERKYFCLSLIGQIYHDPYNLDSTVDDDVASFLRDLKQTGALQNTLLMVLGDHGPRFGRFRYTYQGMVEERLPLMALVLPEKFKACQPKITATVKANSRVLTTHFDVFSTALDAMDLQEHANSFRVRGASIPRAMSLLKPIPKNRSCGEAGVLPHWCVCSKWLDVPRPDIMYTKVANVLAEFINNLTVPVRSDCEELTLTSIVWVMKQSLKEEVFKNGDVVSGYSGSFGRDLVRPSKEYYQAKIVMSPAGAVFEGTVAHAVASGAGAGVGALALRPGDVSRISAYGEEAACVADTRPDLLKYCYCRKRTFMFSYKTMKIS